MTRKDIWQIRLGLLILLVAVAGIAVWLAGSGKTYRSWEDIRKSGTLRAVTALPVEQVRPQQELLTSQVELAMLERFALDNELELLVFRRKEGRLHEALSRNWADVAFSELEPGSAHEYPRLREVPTGLGTVWWIPHAAINLEKHFQEFNRRKAAAFRAKTATGDLALIRERRILRILVVETPPLHRWDRNQLRDFEYDLTQEFAEQLEVRPVVFHVPDRETMERWLLEGRGDMGMAALPSVLPKPELPFVLRREYAKMPSVVGVLPYLDDFNRLMPGTEDAATAEEATPPGGGSGISLLLIPGVPTEYAWFFRSADSELKKAADACIAGLAGVGLQGGKSHYRMEMTADGLRFSPFDHWIKKYAAERGFDWLLIAAQIFQESRFVPGVVAGDGGLGLMQLMPLTAREMNCADPLNPRQNIQAGTAYLAKQYGRLGDGVEPRERLRFALAAYNGGYGHLEDARKLAGQLGLDPNRWQGNVEKAYNLLSRKEYYSKARYGFCRSDIIIRYVNEIMARYLEYTRLNREATETLVSSR
jgi:membrane-bound lytic murein transglycosylase F